MRRISFIFAILGIFLLIVFLFFIPNKELKNVKDLNKTINNEKVILSGVVQNEKTSNKFRLFNINKINVICSGCKSYSGKFVKIKGVIDDYEGKKEVRVLEIQEG